MITWRTITPSQHEAWDDTGKKLGVIAGDMLHSVISGKVHKLSPGKLVGEGAVRAQKVRAAMILDEELAEVERKRKVREKHLGIVSLTWGAIVVATAGVKIARRVRR